MKRYCDRVVEHEEASWRFDLLAQYRLYAECRNQVPDACGAAGDSFQGSLLMGKIGGGFHQPVSAMLGATPGAGPFRPGAAHRAPWPPPSPAHHASAPQPQDGFGRFGVSGGLYSLFPGNTEASAAIYSQATSTSTRFAHSANTYHSFIGSHKVADSLFTSNYAFGGGTPPPPAAPGLPFSPGPPVMERGITQLEMMAKGFNNNNNTTNNNNNNTNNNNLNGALNGSIASSVPTVVSAPTKMKTESKQRRVDCGGDPYGLVPDLAERGCRLGTKVVSQQQQQQQQHQQQQQQQQAPPPPSPASSQQHPPPLSSSHRRWERDLPAIGTPPMVKNEVINRPSCGCRRNGMNSNSPPLGLRPVGGGCHVSAASTGPETPPAAAASLPPPASAPTYVCDPGVAAKKAAVEGATTTPLGGGCSRTNPVALRTSSAPANAAAAASVPPLDWALQTIKKEPGLPPATTTPCQVAEVTTSVSPLAQPGHTAAVVKVEAVPPPPPSCTAPVPPGHLTPLQQQQLPPLMAPIPTLVPASGMPLAKKEPLQPPPQHTSMGSVGTSSSSSSIPVGIAVARQRAPSASQPPPTPPAYSAHAAPAPASTSAFPAPPPPLLSPSLPPPASAQPGAAADGNGGGGGAAGGGGEKQAALALSMVEPRAAPAPAPDAAAAAAADLAAAAAAAPAPPALSAMVLQPQCGEERVANGMAPWTTTATHNSALTPPTLWQYPAHVPVQLGPSDHMPLPPVGYQLVRDPITGHLLLIPATNIEHLQRAVLWPSYPATLQPSLHMATQPATQHIQLFEPTEPNEFLSSLSAAHNHNGQAQGQTARILVQPQLTLATSESPLPKRKGTVIKVEAADCSALEVKSPGMSRPPDVTVTTNASAQVFSGNTSVAHFYYEHPTAVVQLAQTPQPNAAVQTDNGKRSQATSPVNPAETSLTPPPETASVHLESEDAASSISVPGASGNGDNGGIQVQVQDASNQTDTPPVSEDETGDAGSAPLVSLCFQSSKTLSTPPALLQPPTSMPTPVVTTTTITSSVTTAVMTMTNSLDEYVMPPKPESAQDSKPPSAETILPVVSNSATTTQMVDVSGLELLSNSIEQFEIHCSLSDTNKQTNRDIEQSIDNVNSQVVNGLLTLCHTPAETSLPEIPLKPKQEADVKPVDQQHAADALQMLYQQPNIKVEQVQCTGETDNCDKVLNSFESMQMNSPAPNYEKVVNGSQTDATPGIVTSESGICNNPCGSNLLGGLGLLCALAEQRILEEGAGNCSINVSSSSGTVTETKKTVNCESNSNSSGVDVNRNYKTRKSERECKKFIANKVMQYFHQNGNRSGSCSPQHSGVHSLCTSPSSSEIMDAMELDMRMRLAELQRKYREKQRELSKLTPKKASSSESSGGATTDSTGNSSCSPTKRGPGRPRKKCNKLSLESSPISPSYSGSSMNGQSKPRIGRPPILKGKDVTLTNKELPPPVLEKVTDTRPPSRFDSEDCAAPKLKASKLDILKPPTLTANKISFKPALLNSNVSSKTLKLPQCNVNLVKLATNHNGDVKMKENGMKSICDSNLLNKSSCTSLLDEARNKLLFASDKSEKHSAFLSCRLPLLHTACHTFGSKPLSCLTHPGDDNHSWFKTSDKSLNLTSHNEQDTSSVESSDSSASHQIKLFSSLDLTSPSSSKKRKVGRPKKHPSGDGFEDPTETIVAKKPKSKNSLVGFLLSRSKTPKMCDSMQPSPTSSTSSTSSSSSTPLRTFGQSLELSYCNSKVKNGGNIKVNTINGSGLLSQTFLDPKSHLKGDEGTDHKPHKIRPKLKAEAKVKAWNWGEEDDPENMDWATDQTAPVRECIPEWTPKAEKPEKPPVKSNVDVGVRGCKRKLSVCESRAAHGCSKNIKKSLTVIPTSVSKSSATKRDKDSNDQPSPQKRHKRNNCNNNNLTHNGGTTSEGEDLPLSVYSSKLTFSATSNNNNNNKDVNEITENNNNAATSCLLTQTHLNEEKQRALTVMGGLFYAGTLSAIRAPDVYGITIDGERGNRPHIYSREEILRDAILEVRPSDIAFLTPGTRVCAYWSQQYRCLYPGTVAQPTSPDPELDSQFVNVEFDDGDSGRINIDDIRLLPPGYPTLEYDPNPLLTLGKRRRRNSGTSCDSKDRRTSSETPANSNNTNTSIKNSKQVTSSGGEKEKSEGDAKSSSSEPKSLHKKEETKSFSKSEGLKKLETVGSSGKLENLERLKERKRLKKRRKEKLKKLLSNAGNLGPDSVLKKRRKKHRCYEEHCKHKKHHKRHRKHKHRHGSRNKESSSGSSGESSLKSVHGRSDALTRLSPVLERLDILEIQQTAMRSLTSLDCNTTPRSSETGAKVDVTSSSGTSGTTGSEDEDETDTHTPEAGLHTKTCFKEQTITNSADTDSSGDLSAKSISPSSGSSSPKRIIPNLAADKVSSSSSKTNDEPLATSNQESQTKKSKKKKEEEKEKENEKDKEQEKDSEKDKEKEKDKDKESGKPKKHRDRQASVENRSKIAAFLPARQLWGWSGRGFKRPGAKGRGKKEFYKAIQRGKETIMVGDCAVFLSTGRPDRPYIGRIESMWEAWGTNMVVRVKWFYHPEETNGCTVQLKYPGALFESPHVDENDVQTISHKCEVLPLDGYTGRLGTEPERYSSIYDNNDIYYLAGYYDPTTSQLSMKPGVV